MMKMGMGTNYERKVNGVGWDKLLGVVMISISDADAIGDGAITIRLI